MNRARDAREGFSSLIPRYVASLPSSFNSVTHRQAGNIFIPAIGLRCFCLHGHRLTSGRRIEENCRLAVSDLAARNCVAPIVDELRLKAFRFNRMANLPPFCQFRLLWAITLEYNRLRSLRISKEIKNLIHFRIGSEYFV